MGGQDIGQGWDYDYSVIGGQTLATLLLQLLDLFAYLDWCLETSYNAVDSQNRGDKLGNRYVPGFRDVSAAAVPTAFCCGPGLSARLTKLLF